MNLEHISVSNAAGMIKTMKDVEEACRPNAMTAIMIGSITLKPKPGNQKDKGHGRIYYYDVNGGWSLNSLGLPNEGFIEYMRLLPEMVRRAHAAGKELHVSIAGETAEEYANMTFECYKLGVDKVELNFGCPNVWGTDGKQKPIPSYTPTIARRILLTVQGKLPSGQTVDIKISPVEETYTLQQLAEMCNHIKCVSNVVGTNTIPNQNRLGFDAHPALSFNDGNHLGGMAGSELANLSHKVHQKIRKFLHPSVGYKAVGGISTGGLLLRHLQVGACGFQVGTEYYEQGPRVFTQILEEAAEKLQTV